MSIDGIGVSQLQDMLGLGSVGETAIPGVAQNEESEGMQVSIDSVKISKMGESMQELAQLAQDEPEKFTQVTAAMADKLDELAANSTGTESDMYADMADKFRNASNGGGMEALRPDGPPTGMAATDGVKPDKEVMDSVFSNMDGLLSASLAEAGDTAA